MATIQIGDRAPGFTAPTQDGQPFVLADHIGHSAIVLFFYPGDETPICTKEACGFRDAYAEFVSAGALVVGISGDSIESHRRFVANRQLPYTLVSDADGAIRRSYGVNKTLGLFPGRMTFVIDREGIVRLCYESQLLAARHVSEALKMVQTLSRSPASGTP